MNRSNALGPVVVGVSESVESDRALDWAADHAGTTGRRLLIVHAAPLTHVETETPLLLQAEHDVAEAAGLVVDAAARRVAERHPDLEVATRVAVGDPQVALMEESLTAAVLVLGSRRGETRHLPVGSVGVAVTRHAHCPVVVVRSGADPGPLGQRVVLGVDGSSGSRAAAEFAFAYAALHGLRLVILHGSWERLARGSAVLSLLSRSEEHGPTPEEELSIAETIAGLPGRYPDVEFRDEHRSSDPAKALIEASASARLVVVGSRHLGGTASIVRRSVSTTLVEHAQCPVAVVHTA